MDTGVVTIQEPVSSKTYVEEAPVGVVVDKSSMEEVEKVKLSTVLDGEITSRDCRDDIITGEANVSEVVNGSGYKETEESELEKGEEMKTVSVVEEDSNIVKETEKDEQDSVFVHEPESFNKTKEEVSVKKPVVEEDETNTKHSSEQEEETSLVSKAHEEILIKTDEVKEERDVRIGEASINGTESENSEEISVEEISNGVNTLNKTVPDKETATNGETQHEIETSKRVLLVEEKEENKVEKKIDEEPKPNAIEEVEEETVKTVKEDSEIVNNEETKVHESESLKENAERVESVKDSEDAELTSREMDITPKIKELQVQQSSSVVETPTIQGKDIESKAPIDLKEEVNQSSKDTEEHEHVLGRDIPQCETLETGSVAIKEDLKPSLDLKEDKEKEETETVKTVTSSDEVRTSEHIEPCSLEIKDEGNGREESVEVKSKETVQEKNTNEKYEDLPNVPHTESEKCQDKESDTTLVNGTQIMEEQRGLDSNGAEAVQINGNRTDETQESLVTKVLPNVETVEQMQKPSLEPLSKLPQETSKTVHEKIEQKPEEEVTLHQEVPEKGTCGLEKKEETASVPQISEIEEKSQEERNVIDITPMQEESSQTNEEKEETKLEKHEPTNGELKSDEVIEVSSASPLNEVEGETIVEAENIENIKENEEQQAAEKIQKGLETVETVESQNSLPSSSEEQEHVTVSEKIDEEKVNEDEPRIQIKSEDNATNGHERQEEFSETRDITIIHPEQTRDIGSSLAEICSMDQSQPEEQVKEACSRDEQKEEISRNSEDIVNEKIVLHSAEAADEETATNGESLQDVTKKVLLEAEKVEDATELKMDAEPSLNAVEKEEMETVKKVVEDDKSVSNEETTPHESKSLKGDDHQEENAEPVEATKNSANAEQITHEVTFDREKEEDQAPKTDKVQESSKVTETPKIQGEDTESNTPPELKEEVDQSSKDTEEHELVLGRDIPQCKTLETEAVEAKENTKPISDLKKDKEKEVTETAKTVILSDEVTSSDHADVQAEEIGEHAKSCSSEIKDGSQGKEESVEVKSNEIVDEDESTVEKQENVLPVPSEELKMLQDNEPETTLVSKIESQEPGLVAVSMQKPSLESPSELSEETNKTIDEKIIEKPKEDGSEEGSYGLKTEEETVSVHESREPGDKLQEEESGLSNEHEPTKEEVSYDQDSLMGETSDEVIQVSSASFSEERVGETVVEAEKIGDKEVDEEEQVAEKIQKSFETFEIVEPHSSLPLSSEEHEHGTVSEKTGDGKVKETGDVSEKGFENAETTHLSLRSTDEKKDKKDLNEEIQIPSVALPLDEQEKVISLGKEESKEVETEDDKLEEYIDPSTLPMLSEENGNENLTAKAKEGDEETMVRPSKASMLDESKEDKNQEISETTEAIVATRDHTLPIETSQADNTSSSELVSEHEDQTPKQVEEICKEEHKVEATSDLILPVETSYAHQNPSYGLVSGLNDQTAKEVEEFHEEETKETHELQAGKVHPIEVIPRESSDEAQVSMLASKEDEQVTPQEDNSSDDVRETKDMQEARSVSAEIEESVGDTKPKEPEDEIRNDHVETPTSSIILEKNEIGTQITEAKNGDDDINETETTVALDTSSTLKTSENACIEQGVFGNPEAPNLEKSEEEMSQDIPEISEVIEASSDQSLPVKTSQEYQILSSDLASGLDDQTPKQVEEVHEEESKEVHKVQVAVDQIITVETSQVDQTPSLVSEKDDQTSKQVEEISDKETKETHKVHTEETHFTETVPRESFSEAPVSILASEKDELVTPQEGNCAGDTHEKRHISAETEEKVVETKLKEPEAEGAEKSDDHVDTSTILAKIEDENTKKTDIEVAELTNSNPDYSKVDAEHEDETSSTLPVVQILTELQTTLETERAINESASIGEKLISESADQEQKKGDAEEEHKEEVKVQDSISREFEFNVAEKLQEESKEITEGKKEISADPSPTEVLPGEKIMIPSSPLPSEELEHVIAVEKKELHEPQQDVNESSSLGENMILESADQEQKKGDTEEEHKEEVKVQDGISEEFKVSVEEKIQEETKEIAECNEETPTDRLLTEVLPGEEIVVPSPLPCDELEHVISAEKQEELQPQRDVNDSASLGENVILESADQEQKKGDAEEENKKELKVEDIISKDVEVNVVEKIQEETKEIAECKEETPADRSLTKVSPGENMLIPSSPLSSEELQHVIAAEKQEVHDIQQDVNDSTSEKISLQEEHPKDFETSKKEQKAAETHETVKEEDQIVDIKDENKNKEVQDEKLGGLSSTRDIGETFPSEVKKDKEDVSELGVGNDVMIPEVEKKEESHSVLENVEEINEVTTSEKKITDPMSVIKEASEVEHESNQGHAETQAISDDTKSNNDKEFQTEQAPKDQSDKVSADKFLTEEALGGQIQVSSRTEIDDCKENSNPEVTADLSDRDFSVQKASELIHSHQSPNQVEEFSFEVKKAQEDENAHALTKNEDMQVQDQRIDSEAPVTVQETFEQEKKSTDLTDVQEDIGTTIKPEVLHNEIQGNGHDSVLPLKEETSLVEEKREVEDEKTELEDAVKHEVSVEEKNNTSEKIDCKSTKEINQEEIKHTETVKEEIKEEEKETNQECFHNMKNTNNKIQPEIQNIESLSSVSKTQDKSEQKDEVPNQQERHIADEVPKIAEEVHQKEGESENTKDLFSEVKESESTLKEPARKSLSELIHKVKGTDKTEDATTEPNIEEEPKAEQEEEDDGDHEHNKDDKTSPDSLVMVETKDTVSIIKTPKKSQGILSGVGSRVKHSISKVKKVLTGKSSHTTKPSSPQ